MMLFAFLHTIYCEGEGIKEYQFTYDAAGEKWSYTVSGDPSGGGELSGNTIGITDVSASLSFAESEVPEESILQITLGSGAYTVTPLANSVFVLKVADSAEVSLAVADSYGGKISDILESVSELASLVGPLTLFESLDAGYACTIGTFKYKSSDVTDTIEFIENGWGIGDATINYADIKNLELTTQATSLTFKAADGITQYKGIYVALTGESLNQVTIEDTLKACEVVGLINIKGDKIETCVKFSIPDVATEKILEFDGITVGEKEIRDETVDPIEFEEIAGFNEDGKPMTIEFTAQGWIIYYDVNKDDPHTATEPTKEEGKENLLKVMSKSITFKQSGIESYETKLYIQFLTTEGLELKFIEDDGKVFSELPIAIHSEGDTAPTVEKIAVSISSLKMLGDGIKSSKLELSAGKTNKIEMNVNGWKIDDQVISRGTYGILELTSDVTELAITTTVGDDGQIYPILIRNTKQEEIKLTIDEQITAGKFDTTGDEGYKIKFVDSEDENVKIGFFDGFESFNDVISGAVYNIAFTTEGTVKVEFTKEGYDIEIDGAKHKLQKRGKDADSITINAKTIEFSLATGEDVEYSPLNVKLGGVYNTIEYKGDWASVKVKGLITYSVGDSTNKVTIGKYVGTVNCVDYIKDNNDIITKLLVLDFPELGGIELSDDGWTLSKIVDGDQETDPEPDPNPDQGTETEPDPKPDQGTETEPVTTSTSADTETDTRYAINKEHFNLLTVRSGITKLVMTVKEDLGEGYVLLPVTIEQTKGETVEELEFKGSYDAYKFDDSGSKIVITTSSGNKATYTIKCENENDRTQFESLVISEESTPTPTGGSTGSGGSSGKSGGLSDEDIIIIVVVVVVVVIIVVVVVVIFVLRKKKSSDDVDI